MTRSRDKILRQFERLSANLSSLELKLSLALRKTQQTRTLPSENLANAIVALRGEFESARARVISLADGLEVDLTALDEIQSIDGLQALYGQVLEGVQSQRASLTRLMEGLSESTSVDGAQATEVMAAARHMLVRLQSLDDDDDPNTALLELSADARPLLAVQTLVEYGAATDDQSFGDAMRLVAKTFGSAFAAAVIRGRVSYSGVIDPLSPDMIEEDAIVLPVEELPEAQVMMGNTDLESLDMDLDDQDILEEAEFFDSDESTQTEGSPLEEARPMPVARPQRSGDVVGVILDTAAFGSAEERSKATAQEGDSDRASAADRSQAAPDADLGAMVVPPEEPRERGLAGADAIVLQFGDESPVDGGGLEAGDEMLAADDESRPGDDGEPLEVATQALDELAKSEAETPEADAEHLAAEAPEADAERLAAAAPDELPELEDEAEAEADAFAFLEESDVGVAALGPDAPVVVAEPEAETSESRAEDLGVLAPDAVAEPAAEMLEGAADHLAAETPDASAEPAGEAEEEADVFGFRDESDVEVAALEIDAGDAAAERAAETPEIESEPLQGEAADAPAKPEAEILESDAEDPTAGPPDALAEPAVGTPERDTEGLAVETPEASAGPKDGDEGEAETFGFQDESELELSEDSAAELAALESEGLEFAEESVSELEALDDDDESGGEAALSPPAFAVTEGPPAFPGDVEVPDAIEVSAELVADDGDDAERRLPLAVPPKTRKKIDALLDAAAAERAAKGIIDDDEIDFYASLNVDSSPKIAVAGEADPKAGAPEPPPAGAAAADKAEKSKGFYPVPDSSPGDGELGAPKGIGEASE